MKNATTNTRAGYVTAPVDAALTAARLAVIGSDGTADYPAAGDLARFVVVESSDDTATLAPIQPGAQIRVTLSGTCDPGDGLKTGTDGVAVAAVAGEAVSLIAEEAGVDGQDVLSRGPTGIPAYSPNELPPIEEGDAGKVLTVATDESGFELAEPAAGGSNLPDPTEGDPGHIVVVNEDRTGYTIEARAANSPLPALTEGDAGKFLVVSSTESGFELSDGVVVPLGDDAECPSRLVPLLNDSNLPYNADPESEDETTEIPFYDMAGIPVGESASPTNPGGGLCFASRAGMRSILGLATLHDLRLRVLKGKLNGSGAATIAASNGWRNLAAICDGNASPATAAVTPSWITLAGDNDDDYVLYIVEVMGQDFDYS